MMKQICTDLLEIHYKELGNAEGIPMIFLHGFPYDIHAYDEACGFLEKKNPGKFRILVPYLRGYGPNRFLSEKTMRSGEQAALASDLVDFMDALGIPKAIVGGFDWGGRAACVVSALYPERVIGLITCGAAYNIQNPLTFQEPSPADREWRSWYVFYFHTERGSKALSNGALDLTKHLWKTWSPGWDFSEETFLRSAEAFRNPDFPAVVKHSYMHRTGEAEGDPRYQEIEDKLSTRPLIPVPAVILLGEQDTVTCAEYSAQDDQMFPKLVRKEILPGVGHNAPQEAPEVFADAVTCLAQAGS